MSALPISLRPDTGIATLPAAGAAPAAPAHAPAANHDVVARRGAPGSPSLHDAARAANAGSSPIGEHRREALVGALLAHIPAADRSSAKTAIPAIIDAARKNGSADPNQLAYLLATAQTESDFGAHMVETGHSQTWFNRNYGGEDGNRPGTNDGFAYRGRGYVQLTHAGRYGELSHRLGLPDVVAHEHGKPVLDQNGKPKMEPALVAQPDRLTDPHLAAAALVVGVKHNLFTHNAAAAIDKTIPAGHQPGDADFYHARAIVNGIVKDQAQAIAAHATTYAQILSSYRHSVLGVAGGK